VGKLQGRKPQRLRRCSCCESRSFETLELTNMVSSSRQRKARCNSGSMKCREKFVFLAAVVAAVSAADSGSSTYIYSGSASIGQTKGIVLTEDFCNRNYMQISRLSILCNTPGAYYHGSNAYRNSEVCMSGDKANLDVSCKCQPLLHLDLTIRILKL
jgi:hypothetical protein